MALEIKENKGFFEVIGKVTSQNIKALEIYFDLVLERNDNIIISIEKVREMDTGAARLLETIYKKAVSYNKVVQIIGRQNEVVTKIMDITKTAYILSSDRV